jgi:DNA helicase-2/ATP-dependent DNA helicase PcrA
MEYMPQSESLSISRGLNPEQLLAVTGDTGRPLLVLAGAGCGKTTVLTRRIAFLAQEFCSPDKILALTFTRAAAREMACRVESFTNASAERSSLLVTTFHAYGLRVLLEAFEGRQNFTRLGYTKRPRLVTAPMRMRMLAETSTRDERVLLGMDVIELDACLGRRAAFPESAHQFSREQNATIFAIEARYAQAKKKQGLWDFSDFIVQALELWKTHPAILSQYNSRYSAVLVDEFQDTNPMQVRLLKQLLSIDKSFFAVGDDDQAIYGFQGADRSTIIRFAEHFPGSAILKLQTNYRSTPAILFAANKIFRNKPVQYRKLLKAGRTAVMSLQERGMPQKKIFETEEGMKSWMIATMRKMNLVHAVNYSEMAVLFRLNQTRERMAGLFKQEPVFSTQMPLFLTVHSAKGLEFPAVFLCDLEEDIFPDSREEPHSLSWREIISAVFKMKKRDNEGLEEEKRLFYVAVTRAQRFLWLISVRKKELFGRTKRFGSSRFLKLV